MNRKEILIIAIGIFLTVVAWMVIDVYHIKQSPYKDLEMKPVNTTTYNIDIKVLDLLKKKFIEN